MKWSEESMSHLAKQPPGNLEVEPAQQIKLPQTLFLQRELLFNRELSWLEFNRRVLEEAIDQRQPLLERLNFLSIFSSNLDEFFMIRVSGLKQQVDAGVTELSPDGMPAAAQLREISDRLRGMIASQTRCFNEEILAELGAKGVLINPYRALSDRERRALNAYFLDNVFPVLTPLAVDPSHPFPYISNLSLNLGVMVGPQGSDPGASDTGEPRFARIKVPPIVERVIAVEGSDHEFVLLEDLIAANIEMLFPGASISESHAFRVTRDADFEIRSDEAGDLLRTMEEQLHRRRFGSYVRLEVASTMPGEMARYLASSMGLGAQDVYAINGPLDLAGLKAIYGLDRPDLKYRPISRKIPAELTTGEGIFDVLKRQDVLVHHPYDSFSTIEDFILAAAQDPEVLAIKMSLYRVGSQSPIVRALIDASANNKQVAALVELKARFDEENNIEWARQLERAGVHVVYGVLGLKTHAKLAMVVRREGGALRRYVHIGTGNYNPTTARVYEDFGLLTSNDIMGADATDLFNHLTGFSRQTTYRKFLVAPVNLRDRLIQMIKREIEHKKAGREARLIFKLNHMTDTKLIRALYEASQAEVPIDLIVRGICTLRPAVAGLSPTITVRSIVGRFLEHSRIYYFSNGGEEETYIGSADCMYRNFDHRVELLAPIEDPRLRKLIRNEILESYLRDNVKARILGPDGEYSRVAEGDEGRLESQAFFAGLGPGGV
jgi:polyphosphate kinase